VSQKLRAAAHLEQLRDKPDDELRAQLATTRDDLFRLQLGQYTNQVTSTAELTTKRRDIARILTILRARDLGTEKQAQKSAVAAPAAEAAPANQTNQTKKTRKAKAK
jgi:large subunit ribosomal protein L29